MKFIYDVWDNTKIDYLNLNNFQYALSAATLRLFNLTSLYLILVFVPILFAA